MGIGTSPEIKKNLSKYGSIYISIDNIHDGV
jgi:hypothetical protein